MLRKIALGLLLSGLIVACGTAQAQFGRLGPGGFRPPLPPLPPIPAPVFAGPGYIRVPGVPPVVPAVVARPSYGYGRSGAVVAVPLVVPVIPSPYSTARIAVVQPAPANQYRAGSASYATPSTSLSRPTPAPMNPELAQSNNATASGDLRPGMVLPDGAIVLSVGQPGNTPTQTQLPSAKSVPAIPSTAPTVAPQLGQPTGNEGGTKSILEPAEELPVPQPSAPASGTPTGVRKF